MSFNKERQLEAYKQKGNRPDELIVNMLSDTLFLIQNDVVEGLRANEELISSTSDVLADITHKEWKKLLQKDNIKIQTELDPEILLLIHSISEKSKSNTDAINNLADKLVKSLDDVKAEIHSLSKKYDDNIKKPTCNEYKEKEEKERKAFFDKEKAKKAMSALLPFVGTILVGIIIGKFF